MSDKEYFEKWAQEHQLMTIAFYWREKGSDSELRLKNRTYNEGLKMALVAGYTEPRWYKPWTWANGVVTVG